MELNLDGGEISVLKAMGLHGTELTGEELLAKLPGTEAVELIDTLKGLILVGYVETDRRSIYTEDDLKIAHFNVNSGYSRDLKEALDPSPRQKSRRVRRE